MSQVSVRGHGCSISQSSGSMMGEAIKGLSREECRRPRRPFPDDADQPRRITEDDSESAEPEPGSVMGELDALQGVRRYPVRIKCASLPWTTLVQAIGQ